MKDADYLWDRSGEPDPEVARLERLLGSLGHDGRMLALPPVVRTSRPSRSGTRGVVMALALAASVAFLVATTVPRGTAAGASWSVVSLSGTPTLGSRPLDRPEALRAGGWIETDPASRARLIAADVGMVDVEPGTRVRFIAARTGGHRLALQRGTLQARIWAEPGQFYVDTPSATAIDLGCAYTLKVDADGTARLHVTTGWVGVEDRGREVFVPAGASCVTRAGSPPGIPRLDSVPAVLANALAAFEDSHGAGRDAALETVLAAARPEDAFTLWHLFGRVDGPSAARVYDRLAALAPPPPGATRAAVLGGDRGALDAWWNSLGLGDTAWYRRHRAVGGS